MEILLWDFMEILFFLLTFCWPLYDKLSGKALVCDDLLFELRLAFVMCVFFIFFSFSVNRIFFIVNL